LARTNTAELTIIDNVVQLSIPPGKEMFKKMEHGKMWGGGEVVCILDGSIENLGGEVIRSYITTNCNGIAASSLDLVRDCQRLLFVEATIVSTM